MRFLYSAALIVAITGVSVDAEAWNPVRAIKRAARVVSRAASSAAHSVERGVSDAARATARAARAAADKARDALDEVRKRAEKAAKIVSDGVKKIGSTVTEMGKKLGSTISAAAHYVKDGLEYLVKLVGEFWEMIVDWVVSQAKALANKAINAAKEGVKKIFSGIKKALQDKAEAILRPAIKEIATQGARLPMKEIERLAKLQRGGKLDEVAIRGEVRKLVLGHLDPHIVPHVKWAVAEAFDVMRKGIDAAVKGVASGLGSIPLVGGPVFAAVIFAYNFAMETVYTEIAQLISNFVKNKMLTGIVDELLKPVIKGIVAQLQRLIDATGIPLLAKKITDEVKRDVALAKQLYSSVSQIAAKVEHLDEAMKAKVEAVVARKLAAVKRYEEVAKRVLAEAAAKVTPLLPAPGAPTAPTPPARPGGQP